MDSDSARLRYFTGGVAGLPPPATGGNFHIRYRCVNGECVETFSANGLTLEECQRRCAINPPPPPPTSMKYDCSGRGCVPNPRGRFPNRETCLRVCGLNPPPRPPPVVFPPPPRPPPVVIPPPVIVNPPPINPPVVIAPPVIPPTVNPTNTGLKLKSVTPLVAFFVFLAIFIFILFAIRLSTPTPVTPAIVLQ